MSQIEEFLRKGMVIEGEGEKGPFKRIEDLVQEWERVKYPNVTTKLHMSIKNSKNRMKLICCLNSNNVVEGDRLCSFKVLAISKDSDNSAIISKNVCLEHSCQASADEFLSVSDGRTGKIISSARFETATNKGVVAPSEPVVPIVKKRKIALTQKEKYRAAWRLLADERTFAENCFAVKNEFVGRIGVFEARDLSDLGPENVEYLTTLMKDVPSKKLARLLHTTSRR